MLAWGGEKENNQISECSLEEGSVLKARAINYPTLPKCHRQKLTQTQIHQRTATQVVIVNFKTTNVKFTFMLNKTDRGEIGGREGEAVWKGDEWQAMASRHEPCSFITITDHIWVEPECDEPSQLRARAKSRFVIWDTQVNQSFAE